MKKFGILILFPALLALCLLTACGRLVPDESSSVSETPVRPEIAADQTVRISLSDCEPVELDSGDARTVLELLQNAELSETALSAANFLAVAELEDGQVFSFFEGEEGALVITASDGVVMTAESGSFLKIISGDAFIDAYKAECPFTLLCGGEDYSASVTVDGQLNKTTPDGTKYDTDVSSEGEDTPVSVTELSHLVELNFEVMPTAVTVHITDEEEKDLMSGGTLEELSTFLPSSNGICNVTVTAAWQDGGRTGFQGNCTYSFRVSYDLPCVVQSVQTNVVQGQPIMVLIRNAEELTVTATGIKYDPYFLEEGDTKVLIYPTHYNTSSGSGVITVETEMGAVSVPFTISPYTFEVQELEISDELAESTVNNDTANYVYTITAQAINEVSDEGVIYFTEPFIQPAEGEITTEFGMKRYINGEYQSVHAGIDIAAEDESPVLASNAGRVVFAEELQLTGNTVVIEHGSGIKTWYYHMSSLNVQEGDMVEQGDTIGYVGSTGFSTGPHLHFACTVDGIYFSPWYLFGYDLFDTSFRENAIDWPEEEEESEEEDSEEDSDEESEEDEEG